MDEHTNPSWFAVRIGFTSLRNAHRALRRGKALLRDVRNGMRRLSRISSKLVRGGRSTNIAGRNCRSGSKRTNSAGLRRFSIFSRLLLDLFLLLFILSKNRNKVFRNRLV